MSALSEKMRAARRKQHPIGGRNITIQRPTELEMTDIFFKDGMLNPHNCPQFVVDWDFREMDLMQGGTDEPVPFDRDAFIEWLGDQSHQWQLLIDAVLDDYKAFKDKKAVAEGN